MAKERNESTGRSAAGKRETIDPRGDKRYVRRNENGQFNESDDVSRSLSRDQRQTAKNDTKPGYGDKGDRKNTAAKKSGNR